MFYDLHVHTTFSIGENSLSDVIDFARRLGLGGIGIVQHFPEISELPTFDNIDAVRCVMLRPRNANDLDELAAKVREKCEVLMVHGGDYDVNRAACENPLIDVLCHPEMGRHDSGLDHVCTKAASENNVAIEINFREILDSARKNRIYVLSAMKKNIKLAAKYKAPVITTSGALSKWDMRSGRELAAITNLLGMDVGNAIDTASAVPETVVRNNRARLGGTKWEGIDVVK